MADSEVANGMSSSSDDESPSTVQPQVERTLTDHLNKRLLESFRERLAEGTFTTPTNKVPEQDDNNDNDSFDES